MSCPVVSLPLTQIQRQSVSIPYVLIYFCLSQTCSMIYWIIITLQSCIFSDFTFKEMQSRPSVRIVFLWLAMVVMVQAFNPERKHAILKRSSVCMDENGDNWYMNECFCVENNLKCCCGSEGLINCINHYHCYWETGPAKIENKNRGKYILLCPQYIFNLFIFRINLELHSYEFLLLVSPNKIGTNHIRNILKSLEPFIAEFYGHGENNRFDSFVSTNNQYRSFSNHTRIKLIKKPKTKTMSTVNRMFRISRFLTTDIHRRTEWLGQ